MTGHEVTTDAPVRTALAQKLALRIGRDWESGDRLPTLRQLAEQLSVSTSTVRLAVRDLVDEGLLVSRRRSGTFVSDSLDNTTLRKRAASQFGPQAQPRHYVNGSDHRALFGKDVTIVLPVWEIRDEFGDPFTGWLVDSLTDNLRQGGANPTSIQGKLDDDILHLDRFDGEAFVVLNPNSKTTITSSCNRPVAVVSTAVEVRMAMTGGFDMVSVDQQQGGLLAGRTLAAAGGRHACFLGSWVKNGSEDHHFKPTCEARLNGFRIGFQGEGRTIRELGMHGYTVPGGARSVPEFLKLDPRPDVIFAATDELAVGFVFGAMSHGLEPLRDYQIIGFDGQERARTMPAGPLTTIEVPVRALGQRAANLLAGRLAQPDQPSRRVYLGTNLLKGNTVRLPDGTMDT